MDTGHDSKLQAALLRVTMELRTKGATLQDATAHVADRMGLSRDELGAYLRQHLGQLMTVARHDLVREKAR